MGAAGLSASNWQDSTELIAAANVTIKTYGPDRVAGFSPIRRCRWFLTPPERVICHCLAAPV
ncbi:hypothetical protein ACLB1M_12690 [Escherichia coli]